MSIPLHIKKFVAGVTDSVKLRWDIDASSKLKEGHYQAGFMLVLCFLFILFYFNKFIKIQFTYHGIHPLKMYN